ncbi:AzlD domain-containing protein [Priestia koreensis]|uniref:AzlD domain-containing protein n=1 Tax=Priestia koreensis TaxID=284581 RepID=UPI001F5A658C|nr:AzlD domain-containing protein [Priestia koreensis]MCM3004233.1 AzlD domain-containing protein [Priestia koreensis]UNL83449.1 AzlD domain-containing protein [Priestia koreensis]
MIWIVIIGMSIATLIPRLLPAVLMSKIAFPTWMKKWLEAIPYAALGALIFPGIMSVNPDHQLVGIIGGIVAILLGLLNVHIIFVIAGAIGSVMLSNWLIVPLLF